MLQRLYEAARATFSARFARLVTTRRFALDQLGEPQRETLLADSTGSGKQ
jgi:hypothetical protein